MGAVKRHFIPLLISTENEFYSHVKVKEGVNGRHGHFKNVSPPRHI